MAVRAMAQLRMRRQQTPFQRQSHKPSKDLTPARQDEREEAEEAETKAVPVAEVAAADAKQVAGAEVLTADTVQAPEAEKSHPDDVPRAKIHHPPIDRDGKRRGPNIQVTAKRPKETRPPGPQVELACWKKGLTWVLGVEVSTDSDKPTVTQSDEPLESDMRDPSLYPIRYVGSTVTVCCDGIEKHFSVGDHGRNPLVFKMGKNWTGIGRLVTHPTHGHYIAVAPHSWNRDESLAGPPLITPEPVRPDRGVVHYFYVSFDEPKAISFISEYGRRVQVEPRRARFELIGRRMPDYSEDVGPLMFELPRIKALRSNSWRGVGTIVVGREGRSRHRWRKDFAPDVETSEQDIPLDLMDQHHGWYFVRIYDRNDCLLDSMDFRFVPGLRDICVEGDACLPGPHGHEQASVQFIHEDSCTIQPVDPTMVTALEVRHENGYTVATIPPRPDLDETHWTVRDRGAEIDVAVLVKRMWWSVGTANNTPSDWTDRPLAISCKSFTATTDRVLWIRLPHCRFTNCVEVGFDSSRRRPHPIPVNKREVPIFLREFDTEREISTPLGSNLFYAFVRLDEDLHSAPVLEVTAVIKCRMDRCGFTTASWEKARSHVAEHEPALIPHLSYDELVRRSAGSLPRKIYKCSYGPFYAKTDSLENPTSAIIDHIAFKHPGKQTSFRIVSSVDEIRKYVIANLPVIYQCQSCREEFSRDDRNRRLAHLWEKHQDDLFEIR